MSANTVVAFRPYVAMINVSLDLRLISMEVTLCFGPFDSALVGRKWCDVLEKEHWAIEAREELEDAQSFEENGVPTQVYLRTFVRNTDVIQADPGMRTRGAFIPPKEPTVDAHQIHVYSLAALEEAVAGARRFLSDSKRPA